MQRSIRMGLAGLVLAACGVALAFSCEKPIEPRGGHVELENDTLATPPAQLGGPSGGGVPVNAPSRRTPVLPGHIETLSQSALIAYLKQLGYELSNDGGQKSNVPCTKNGVACAAAESSTVYIQPEMGMFRWKRDSIPDAGIIVARIIDYDTDPSQVEARYGIRPQRHTWWVVDRATAGGPLRSRFVERTYDPNGAAVLVVRDTSYAFRDCGHVNANVNSAHARWWGCDSAAAAVRPRAVASLYVRAEAWVTCGQGCCVADP